MKINNHECMHACKLNGRYHVQITRVFPRLSTQCHIDTCIKNKKRKAKKNSVYWLESQDFRIQFIPSLTMSSHNLNEGNNANGYII